MSCCFRPNNRSIDELPKPKNVSKEILIKIPECSVDIIANGEAERLATGDFEIHRFSEENIPLATVIQVGDDLQWPLTKDEPVVKLDASNYLFSLPIGGGNENPITYGVSFGKTGGLGSLDLFLRENSLFTSSGKASENGKVVGRRINWEEFAPDVDEYNGFLAKAVARGTGQIVKGIFSCGNAYANQVRKGGESIQYRAAENKSHDEIQEVSESKTPGGGNKKKGSINKSVKQARKVSKMTHKLSKSLLDFVGIATGSVITPVVHSAAGKAIVKSVPGQVGLASLDAVNKLLDAVEVAGKHAMKQTSFAVSGMVSKRFGEDAGEATEDALATVGNCAGTAWNVFKIRKALNPAASTPTGVLKNVAKSTVRK